MILDDRMARQSACSALAKLRGARKRAHDGSSSACFLNPGQTRKPKGAPPGLQIPGGHLGEIQGRYIHNRGGGQAAAAAAAVAAASSAQELLSRLTPSPVLAVASSPSPTSSVLSSPLYATAAVQLPINLSTLMPVPLREVKQPQEHALLNGLISTTSAAVAALAPWQGIEAVAESFRAYNQGTNYCRQTPYW